MYKCEWCGTVQEDPDFREEKDIGYASLTCRRCGSDVHEASQCLECEEYFSEEVGDDFFHTAQGEGYCTTCLKALCKVETALEYFAKCDFLEAFVENWLLDGNELPYAKSILMKVIENADDDDEALQAELWSFVAEDASHFAEYIYEKRKEVEK